MRCKLRYAGLAVGVLLWLGLYPASAWAQFPDLVDASVQYLPGVALQEPRPARAQVASYEATLNVPITLGPRTFLIPGAGYHSDAVSYTRTPADFTKLRAFQSVELSLLFVQLLPNNWSLSARLAPGLAADSLALKSDQLRWSALVLGTRTISDRLILGAGGLVSYSFGTFLPLPAVYVEWKPVNNWRIEAFLPAFIETRYTFWDRLELGVRLDVAGNSYAVRDERIRGAWPCSAQPGAGTEPALPAAASQCFDHVAYSVGVVGVVAGVRLFSSVWWTAMAGHSVLRRFDQRNADDDTVSGGLQAMPNAPFVRTKFTWRIPRD